MEEVGFILESVRFGRQEVVRVSWVDGERRWPVRWTSNMEERAGQTVLIGGGSLALRWTKLASIRQCMWVYQRVATRPDHKKLKQTEFYSLKPETWNYCKKLLFFKECLMNLLAILKTLININLHNTYIWYPFSPNLLFEIVICNLFRVWKKQSHW